MTINLVIISLALGIMSGIFVASTIVRFAWEGEAIGRGLALYCPQDGHWAWVGECAK